MVIVLDYSNHFGIVIELSREELVNMLEDAARRRLGVSAQDLIRQYRRGDLNQPGDVADLMALADLLPENDPLIATPA